MIVNSSAHGRLYYFCHALISYCYSDLEDSNLMGQGWKNKKININRDFSKALSAAILPFPQC